MSIVANQLLSLEMLVLRLLYLKDMPSYEAVLESIKKNNLQQDQDSLVSKQQIKPHLNESNKSPKDQIKNISQTKLETEILKQNNSPNISKETISSFEDLVSLSSKKKEVELKYDLERNVNLIKFSDGKIDISFNENLGKNFVRNLSEKLLEWTGKRWVITLTKKTGCKTLLESNNIKKLELLDNEKKEEFYKKFKNTFSDVDLIDVTKKD